MNTALDKTSKPSTPRIAIVDSHASSRIGLWHHIEKLGTWPIAWASSTAEEALEKLEKDTPVALIVEIQLTGKDGLEFIKDLRPLYPDLKILVYSSQNEDFYAERCLRAGALGYLHKERPMRLFSQAVEKVIQGEIYLSPRITRNTLHSITRRNGDTQENNHLHHLTDRELEIMILMGKGISSQMSAEKLRISPRTVQVHRNNIRLKIGLENALQLHAYAMRFYGDEPDPSIAGDGDGETDVDGHRQPPKSIQSKSSAVTQTHKNGKKGKAIRPALKKVLGNSN